MEKTTNKTKKGFPLWAKITSVVLGAAVLLGVCGLCLVKCADRSPLDSPTGSYVTIAEDYNEIYKVMHRERRQSPLQIIFNGGMVVEDAEMVVEESVTSDSASFDSAAPSVSSGKTDSYSQTNVQSAGVDEADVTKTDGKYIYIARGHNLTIVDPKNMTELSNTIIGLDGEKTTGFEFYVSSNRLTAVFDIYTEGLSHTIVSVYDISDPKAPELISTLMQDGVYHTSRMIGDHIYTISNCYYFYYRYAEKNSPETYIPTVVCNGDEALIAPDDISYFSNSYNKSYAVITCVDISSPKNYADTKAVLGGTGEIYVSSGGNMLVASTVGKTEEKFFIDDKKGAAVSYKDTTDTNLALYDLDGSSINLVSSGNVPGTLLNQFSMDEYDDHFRVVTTSSESTQTIYTNGIDSYDYSSSRSSGLYILDSKLNQTGFVDGLGEDETVRSVRFMGDICYFVTFRQTDPLFAADLSDPTSPKILSALKIPGFSSYLHPYDDGLLFGIGYDADVETGRLDSMKLSMFDISDPADVSEICTKILEDQYSSEALHNHKAIIVDKEHNLIAFPDEYTGYLIYGYSKSEGFYKRAEIKLDHWSSLLRGLYIGDEFFVCSDSHVIKCRLDDFSEIEKLELSDSGIHYYDDMVYDVE
ncbi:MAG: beta-propeller domain-containing protein [Clostridia bacterium]|nr:beta-propeller domain-containing protein [Clostridia bacterium]